MPNIWNIICQISSTVYVSKYLVRHLSAGWLVSCSNITSPFPLRPADNKGRLRSSKEKLIERLLPDTNLVYLKLSQFTLEIQPSNFVYLKLSQFTSEIQPRNLVYLELSQFTPEILHRNLVFLKLSQFTKNIVYLKLSQFSWVRRIYCFEVKVAFVGILAYLQRHNDQNVNGFPKEEAMWE